MPESKKSVTNIFFCFSLSNIFSIL